MVGFGSAIRERWLVPSSFGGTGISGVVSAVDSVSGEMEDEWKRGTFGYGSGTTVTDRNISSRAIDDFKLSRCIRTEQSVV